MAVQLGMAFLQAALLGAVAGTALSVFGWILLGSVMSVVVIASLVVAEAGPLDFVLGLPVSILGYDTGLAALLWARYRFVSVRI